MIAMSTIIYKCPNCSGHLEFDSVTQSMKCPFCASVFSVESVQHFDQALDAPNTATRVDWEMPSNYWTPEEEAGMYVYTCQTCAGAIVSDETLGTTSCPYCGNPVVITDRFSGHLKPDLVMPFKLTKDDAKNALLKHYEGKPFLPAYFKEDSRINEIKGVYVPFWLFDSTIDINALYACTNVRTWSDSKYNYTETNHFNVERAGTIEYRFVPVDGSFRLDDTLMESIEPYDFTQLTQFQTAYLSGFSANIYDVDAAAALPRAQERMMATAREVMDTSVQEYSSNKLENWQAAFYNPRCFYALLPVWLLSSTFDGKVYTFAMNGQTGQFVGDLPVDKTRKNAFFYKTFGIAVAIITAILMVLGQAGGY